MAKWLLPASIIFASLILFAAARKNAEKPAPRVAVINPQKILSRDPVYISLKKIGGREGVMAQTGAKPHTLPHKPAAGSPSGFSSDSFGGGFSERERIHSEITISNISSRLSGEMEAARRTFDIETDSSYDRMISELDALFAELDRAEPPLSLLDEKFLLFNLRLKYDAITKDRATIPIIKPDELKSRIEKLSESISRQESEHSLSRFEKQNEQSEKIRENFRVSQKEKSTELNDRMKNNLAESEIESRSEIASYKRGIEETASLAAERRARLRRKAAEISRPAGTKSLASRAAASVRDYEKVFMQALERKVKATAADREYSLVLDMPLYHSSAVNEITGMF